MAATFQGKRVSGQWKRVLQEANKHVTFTLDSGKRTMAEQWKLVREKGVWSPQNPHGAAFPSPNAPHIRVGRANHCLDVDAQSGGQKRLAAYLEKHGVHVSFNVPGEPWHMDPPASELKDFYRRLVAQDKRRR